MAKCIDRLVVMLRAGVAEGAFEIEDPEYMASILWTQILGAMHLARSRVGVALAGPGIPRLFAIEPERVIRTCVASALATVRDGRSRRPEERDRLGPPAAPRRCA